MTALVGTEGERFYGVEEEWSSGSDCWWVISRWSLWESDSLVGNYSWRSLGKPWGRPIPWSDWGGVILWLQLRQRDPMVGNMGCDYCWELRKSDYLVGTERERFHVREFVQWYFLRTEEERSLGGEFRVRFFVVDWGRANTRWRVKDCYPLLEIERGGDLLVKTDEGYHLVGTGRDWGRANPWRGDFLVRTEGERPHGIVWGRAVSWWY